MKYQLLTAVKDLIKIDLYNKNDIIIINEPENIIAFQAENHKNREDFTFDEVKLKKYKRKSKIIGQATIYIKSSNHSSIQILELSGKQNYIFNCNLLAYTEKTEVNLVLKDADKAFLSTDFFQYECSGSGTIIFYAEGESYQIKLVKDEIIFVNPNNVLAYGNDIKYEFRTYGNIKSSLNMSHHYKFTGPGNILLQSQSLKTDITRANNESSGNIITRAIKEIIPGSSIILK